MTSADLIEWLKTGATVVGAAAIVLAYVQFRRTVQWNRLAASLMYLDSVRISAAENTAAAALQSLELEYDDDELALSDEDAKKILATPVVGRPVRHFLNLLEFAAAGINCGALDEEFAYHHRGDYYLRNWDVFDALVKRTRKRVGNNKYWSETQKLCNRWQKRKHDESRSPTMPTQYDDKIARI